jgi:OmpA family
VAKSTLNRHSFPPCDLEVKRIRWKTLLLLASLTGAYCSRRHLIYDPEARITLTAHADVRGRTAENQSLSVRRANRVKPTLVIQDVPEGKIDIVALGETAELEPR